eukprot:4307819-Pyramimonas_sp.AAC.1
MELVPTPIGAHRAGDEEDDARLLGPRMRSRDGRRDRDSRDSVGQMRRDVLDDFPLSGGRSC